MIQYSQKKIWQNSCSYVAILTNLSNLLDKQLDYNDMIIWYNQIWSDGRWALVNTTTIKNVLDWFNAYYKKNIELDMCTIMWALSRIKRWEMGYIGFRRNTESAYDFQVDWVVNKCPIGKMQWWHSANLIWRDGVYVIIDNYFEERRHNEYIVSEPILLQMIANQIIRWACYFFKQVQKKRMLKIK